MIDFLQDNISSIELIDYMGSDLDVVNAARVSYSANSNEFGEKDKKLLMYLAANKHTSPFRHCYIKFKVVAPIYLSRQLYKHVVGIETVEFVGLDVSTSASFKDHGWNEVSGRYTEVQPQFHIPRVYRAQSTTNKQASDGLIESQKLAYLEYRDIVNASYNIYKLLLKFGVAKEQARQVLPLCTYTSWMWTMSLQACLHCIALRDHEGAQVEAQQFAKAMKELLVEVFPTCGELLFS